MKTGLRLLAAVMICCSFAARAHAASLETSGEFRARTWRLEDYVKGEARTDFWDQRLRLALDWIVSEQVKVHTRADILEGMWGDQTGRPQIEFDQVNAQVILTGTPLKLLVGRQDVSWGTGYWVQEDDRDRVAVGVRLDPVRVLIAYDKLTEVFDRHSDREDWQAWAVGAIADAGTFSLGLLAAYMRDGSRIRFTAGDLAYQAVDLFAIGRLGPVGTRAEFVYGSGVIDRPGIGDLDVRGIGAYASASVPLGPVTVTLEGAYAGGDDPTTTGRNEGFFSADYQGPFSSIIFYNNLDYAGYAGDAQASSPALDFSVRNARAGKLSASFAPLRRLTVTGAALYAVADRTAPGVDKAIGWEFDLVAAYELTENVSLTAGFGYALLGDYWKSAPIAAGAQGKPENPLGGLIAFTTRF